MLICICNMVICIIAQAWFLLCEISLKIRPGPRAHQFDIVQMLHPYREGLVGCAWFLPITGCIWEQSLHVIILILVIIKTLQHYSYYHNCALNQAACWTGPSDGSRYVVDCNISWLQNQTDSDKIKIESKSQ